MMGEHPCSEAGEASAPTSNSSPSPSLTPSTNIPSAFPSNEFSDLALLPDYEAFGIATETGIYEHQNLDSNFSQIRLIEIIPEEDDGRVCCRSSVHDLDDEPQYVALSYAWGSPPSQHVIELDGQEFLVRKNLLRFLKHARIQQSLANERFWIDAICIDQSNPNERTHQVSLMPQIYKGAYKVIAWVGPAYRDSDTAMDYLSTFRSKANRVPRVNSIWSSACGPAIAELCARSYWTRLWVFQELLLSRQTFMMCGDRLLDLKTFHMLLSTACGLATRARTRDRLTYQNAVNSPAMAIVRQVIGQEQAGDGSLLGLIIATQNLQCADFRDKVYALLGVATVGHAGIVADYDLPLQTLASHVLREHHRHQGLRNLDELLTQLKNLCSCFGVDLSMLLQLHARYEGFFEIPTDCGFDIPVALLTPSVRIFLWGAYYHQHDSFIRNLLADEKSRNSISNAFMGVVYCRSLAAIKMFLEIDAEFRFLGQKTKFDALVSAAVVGNHEAVEMLIVLGKANADEDLWDGRPIVHLAISLNYLDVFKTLLKFSQIDINLSDNDAYTALHLACEIGRSEVVRLLLAVETIEVNTPQWKDRRRTALHLAVDRGHLAVVESLLCCSSVDVNMRDVYGSTALHLASTRREPDIARALLAHKQIDVNVQQHDGSTALHRALSAKRWAIVKAILSIKGVDVNKARYGRATALHLAMQVESFEMVEALLRHSEVDINAQRARQGTLLHQAAEAGHLDVLRVLLRDERLSINIQRAKGASTALHLATFSGHLQVVRELLEHPEINVNIKDSNGHTPLSLACSKGYLDIVKSLLAKHDLGVDMESFGGLTTLMLAVEGGEIDTVRALLEKRNTEVDSPG